MKYTQEQFKSKVFDLVGDEYSVLGDYKNNRTNILMKHNICEQLFSPIPKNFLSGTRCPYCAGRRSNKVAFERELHEQVGDEYRLLGDYKNKSTKVNLFHSVCKEIYQVAPVHFLKTGSRCPICVHKKNGLARQKTHEVFVEELNEKYNGQFIALEKYQTALTDIKFKHLACGEEFLTTPNKLLTNNTNCPKCSQSAPETIVEGYLITNNLIFKREHKFDDCLGKRKTKLPFDFAIFDENQNLILLIEYDGQQHYRPSFGEENFKRTIRNDNIKNKYCEDKEIKLIRIPYWEIDNIQEILDKHLVQLINSQYNGRYLYDFWQ